MKKLNNQGFTLIELLAVITIMGILMMVAIPAVSRTIDNSRKDTFKNNAQQYANEALTKWAADQIYCGSDQTVASALGEGLYIIPFATTDKLTTDWKIGTTVQMQGFGSVTPAQAYANATSLVANGGKSSWGNQDVYGYVFIVVKTESSGASSGDTLATRAYVTMRDGANHGIEFPDAGLATQSTDLRRNNVATSGITSAKIIVANKNVGITGKQAPVGANLANANGCIVE